jgi:hypothetical protein
LLTLLLLISVAGCWIPEKFTARVVINKDGSYSFTYDGILTFALALAAAKEGKLSPKDEAAFKKEEEKIRKEPGFKKVTYTGNGRYEVLVERERKQGEPTYFVSRETKIFSVVPKQDGTIEVSGLKLTEKDLAELRKIGAKVDGYLKVSVGKGVEVVKHNASSTPKFFGLFGDYEWHIKSPDVAPFIIVRPSS